MQIGKQVSIIKVDTINYAPAIKDTYVVEGELMKEISHGTSIEVARRASSKHGMDREVQGLFKTSPVRKYQSVFFGGKESVIAETENSIYYIKFLSV